MNMLRLRRVVKEMTTAAGPVADLLMDLQQRGLLEDTLVWWGGEFGRAPYAKKNGAGRDHNPAGFTIWLAGAGVNPGFALGDSDEFGGEVADRPVLRAESPR